MSRPASPAVGCGGAVMHRNIGRRLSHLEAAAAARRSADADVLRRVNELLAYRGDDPSVRRRQARLGELLALARRRMSSAGGRRL